MNYSLVHHFVINLMQSGNLLLYRQVYAPKPGWRHYPPHMHFISAGNKKPVGHYESWEIKHCGIRWIVFCNIGSSFRTISYKVQNGYSPVGTTVTTLLLLGIYRWGHLP